MNDKINLKHVKKNDYVVFGHEDYGTTLWKIIDPEIHHNLIWVEGYSGKRRRLPASEAIRYGEYTEIIAFERVVKAYRKVRNVTFELEELLEKAE